MKPNEDKCHLLIANNSEELSINLNNNIIKASNSVDLLGIKIDNKLDFSDHITKLCRKGNQKLHALARISKYIDEENSNSQENFHHISVQL